MGKDYSMKVCGIMIEGVRGEQQTPAWSEGAGTGAELGVLEEYGGGYRWSRSWQHGERWALRPERQ